MSITGIVVSEPCITAFEKLKMERKYRWITYKISEDEKTIEIDKFGERDNTFGDFVSKLAKDQARYAVYDLEFKTKDGRHESKVIFVLFCPDTLKVKEKFKYASSKDTIKNSLVPINKDIQVQDLDDLNEEDLIKSFDK